MWSSLIIWWLNRLNKAIILPRRRQRKEEEWRLQEDISSCSSYFSQRQVGIIHLDRGENWGQMLPSLRSHSEASRHESSAMGPQSSLLLWARSSSSAKTTGHSYGPGGPAGSWKVFPVREKSSLNIHRAKDISHLPHVTIGNDKWQKNLPDQLRHLVSGVLLLWLKTSK